MCGKQGSDVVDRQGGAQGSGGRIMMDMRERKKTMWPVGLEKIGKMVRH